MRSGQDSRWYSGAGLHRPVVLHVDEPVHVVPDGVSVTTVRVEDDQAVVDVVTTVANAGLTTQTITVDTSLDAPDGGAVERDATPSTLAPGETALVRQRFYVQQPQLWGPDHPALYRPHLAGGGDRH